jgi:hypothetical protein
MAITEHRLRQITERAERAREDRDELIRLASEQGMTRRKVAAATGLSFGRIQQIVSAALAVALVMLIGVGSAQGHHPEELTKSQAIARAIFPGACEPTIPTEHEILPTDPSAPAWTYSPSAYEGWDCRLVFSELIHHPGFRSAMVCTIIVHEYGHLAGYGHSDNPAAVMYPTTPTVYPACAAAFPPPRRTCPGLRRQLKRATKQQHRKHLQRKVRACRALPVKTA